MYKKVGLFVAVLAAVGCWAQVLAGTAMAAETGGYPYADKPCVHAPYAAQGAGANWCANYDFGDRREDLSAGNVISPYGYYYRNCTDYVAWRLANVGVPAQQYKGLGNARQWAQPPARNGLHVDGIPVVGSVGVRTSGTYGHVAYVEAVYVDGTIRVAQYNKQATGNYSTAVGTPAALGLTRFVHFDQYLPAVAIPAPSDVPAVVLAPDPVPTDIPAADTALDAEPAAPQQATVLVPDGIAPSLDAAAASTEPVADMTVKPYAAATTALALGAEHTATLPQPLPDQPATAPAPQPVIARTDEVVAMSPSPLSVPLPAVPPRSAPDMPAPPQPASLRQAGFATIVVPYHWWQDTLPAPPSRLAAATVGKPGRPSLTGYAALALLVVAGITPGLPAYRRWFATHIMRYHIVRRW